MAVVPFRQPEVVNTHRINETTMHQQFLFNYMLATNPTNASNAPNATPAALQGRPAERSTTRPPLLVGPPRTR